MFKRLSSLLIKKQIASFSFSGHFFQSSFNRHDFSEKIRVVVEAFRAFQRFEIGTDGDWGELPGLGLVKADAAFDGFHSGGFDESLLFSGVVAPLSRFS